MCAPSPPPPPDYAAAATAQGAANKEAAIASSRLNNPNVVSPYGTQTFTENGEDGRPTVTQTFSPEQQALFEQSLATKQQLGELGQQGATALQGIVGKDLDLSGAPAVGSYDDTRNRVIDAMMGRADEDYAATREKANSDLIAAGIRPGTKAYADRMQQIERSHNDARQQAEIAGGNAATQAFATDTQRRKDVIAELLAQRQTPLNEVSALMSGSQVNNPFAMPGVAQNANIAPAPVFNATVAKGQYDTDLYNANAAQQGNMMNGLFSLGSAGIGAYGMMNAAPFLAASDRRLKSNIVRVGTHPLGIGIYEYDIGGEHRTGVMADEVLEVKPEAVLTMPNGYMAVDYGML